MAQNRKKKKAVKRPSRKNTSPEKFYLKTFGAIGLGIILALFMYVASEAPVNIFCKKFILGLFGLPGGIVPFILIGVGIYHFNSQKKFGEKLALCFGSLVCISAMLHICMGNIVSIADSYSAAASDSFLESFGGGLLGALIACPLRSLIGGIAGFVILLLVLLGLVSLIIQHSVFAAIYGALRGLFGAVRESAREIDTDEDYNKVYDRTKKAAKKKIESKSMAGSDMIKEALDFSEDQKTKKGTAKKDDTSKETDDYSNGIDIIFGKMAEEASAQAESVDEQPEETSAEISAEADFEEESVQGTEVQKRESNLTVEERDAYTKEIEEGMEVEIKEYEFPDIELLNKKSGGGGDSRQQMYETSNKLISILENFGVKAKLLQVTQGPAVTRYEIQPSSGVKLSKIVGLADDLALNLAVPTVLVAAVPGKAAVGIEVPNKETASVTAREMLEADEFVNSKSKLSIALGRDIGGRVVVGDIAKMPHVLIAGSTGSGKSVCINTIITSLLYKASPDEVKLIMVDPKVVELGVYNGIPHLLIPVVTDPKKAAGALNWAVGEMMRRYDVFAQEGVKNLAGYNLVMEKTGGTKLPQIVIIIDELADLMMVAAKEVEDYICRLAQLARAAGIHLIVATQRPTVDVITGLIKANIPTRIAFAVASQIDSRTIIDRGGAEKLLGKGDMLYAPQGCRSPIRVQGAYVSDDEIERLLDFLKAQNADAHYSTDLEEHIERVATGENGVTPDTDDDGDELLPQAVDLAIELGQISTAMIQRRLKVGYSRAGRIIDQLEERGIIGPPNGSKPRQVYVSHADFAE